MSTPLDDFSAPVRTWFREALGEPTPPQTQGWPPIQRGEHTLILAPTGSGKTLAAFLWGIDELFRENQARNPGDDTAPSGVRLVYISPLKALNNDIERNLRVPLEGIRAVADRTGQSLPELRVAVRTGDTPSHVRAAMWKKPPQILITTPESLYLILTSSRAREMFRTVRTVIVDEIHTLCGTKRGVHLSLSLERLNHLATARVQRIGLSATIKPLDEVARFLGGQEQASNQYSVFSIQSKADVDETTQLPREREPLEEQASGQSPNRPIAQSPSHPLTPRPVTIVNAAYRKPLDLRVITVVEDFRNLPGNSIWPYVIPHVLQDVREHRSTLVFTNNRRLAERTADRLNAQLAAEQTEEIAPGSTEALAPGGVPRDRGIFAIGAEGPIRAHHGSMAKEARRKMEEDLKSGKLPALVGTSSLELGIDIGSVDLVVQLQSPKSVAQGLQRIGRAGHMVGETSVGHIYPTFREDLVEAAAIARGMLEGDVEPTYTPQSPLDVLAQQIVAMVAVEDWPATELYHLVTQAYAYHTLSRTAFDAVLGMIAGKFPNVRARVSWDRQNDRLSALPGSRLLAMMNPGTISDTGAFNVYLQDQKTKVGELDEEFIFETRVGDTFLLGSKVWRVIDLQDDRVVVGDAAGAVPRMPFWKGDYPWRPYELGQRIGKFRREIADLLRPRDAAGATPAGEADILKVLMRDYALDASSAHNLIAHVQQQLDSLGALASDKTIVVESYQDTVGEPRLVIHSPFGGRVNGAWALALNRAIRERTGVQPETQTNDDGILFRFPQSSGEPPLDLIRTMTAATAREYIMTELAGSAVFGAHFRMNAARALLLPKAHGSKRTPFWLQRLKAKDLLAIVSQFDDFPIVAETYRDCLHDVLDLPHLEEILSAIVKGEMRVVSIETAVPSPVASELEFQFANVYMYEWDAPKAERQLQALSASHVLLDDLLQGVDLAGLFKPEAVALVAGRQQHLAAGYQARSAEELAVILEELGDLTTEEIVARCAGDGRAWLAQLAEQRRVVEIAIPTPQSTVRRWVPAELEPEYASLLGPRRESEDVLHRLLRISGPVTRETILNRYAFDEPWLDQELAKSGAAHQVVRGHFSPSGDHAVDEFLDRRNLEQIHQRTLTILRKEVQPVPLDTYVDFLARWQHASPRDHLTGEEGLRQILQQLQGVALPSVVWERDALPARLTGYVPGEPGDLDTLCETGELVGVAEGNRLRLFFRGEGGLFLDPLRDPLSVSDVRESQSAEARALYDYLKSEGTLYTRDLETHLKLSGGALHTALAELVTAGWVTNDRLDALYAVLGAKHLPTAAETSPLEAELSARLQGPRPLTRGRYREAKRRVARRLRGESQVVAIQGRWSLVHRASVLGPAVSEEERAQKLVSVLLARYGVVMRECLEHEAGTVDWTPLYPVLQRLEMRGQIRRGYFVSGLSGIQFALPEAVERLRAVGASAEKNPIVLNATDPANLFGGERQAALGFARLASTWVVLQSGQPLLVAEEHGDRIRVAPDTGDELARASLQLFLDRPNAPRHMSITAWNQVPVLGSAAEPLLRSLGFHRSPTGMER